MPTALKQTKKIINMIFQTKQLLKTNLIKTYKVHCSEIKRLFKTNF